MALTVTKDLMLPATVTGSWPRPRWFDMSMWAKPLDTCMQDIRYREKFHVDFTRRGEKNESIGQVESKAQHEPDEIEDAVGNQPTPPAPSGPYRSRNHILRGWHCVLHRIGTRASVHSFEPIPCSASFDLPQRRQFGSAPVFRCIVAVTDDLAPVAQGPDGKRMVQPKVHRTTPRVRQSTPPVTPPKPDVESEPFNEPVFRSSGVPLRDQRNGEQQQS